MTDSKGQGAEMDMKERIDSVSERSLIRALWVLGIFTVLSFTAFGVVYFMGQHVDSGQSLIQRKVQTAEQSVRKTPRNISLRLQLAQLYQSDNEVDAALKQYEETLKIEPFNRSALLGQGAVLLAKERYVDAGRTFQKVIELSVGAEFSSADPQLALAHYQLGQIALKQGEINNAVSQLSAAVTIEPTDADAWYLLGTANTKIGAYDKAVDNLRRALAFVPTGWCEPYSQLSLVYSKINQTTDAEYAGAMVDFCQGRVSSAKSRLQILAQSASSVDAALGLGMISERESNRPEAVKWYRVVLAIDPKNFNAVTGLGRLGVTEGTVS